MKRYGIMGGTFNPIHIAHLYIAYEALDRLRLDKIIFMPAGNPPHKNNGIIHSDYRYNMVKMAIDNYEKFDISDYEIKKNGLSYTYETLEYLKNSENELYFIAGGDSLMDFETWKEPSKILKNCNLVIFNRGKDDREKLEKQKEYLQNKYKGNIILLDIMDIDISSTIVRERIKLGKSVEFFLPEAVNKYIKINNLYKGD